MKGPSDSRRGPLFYGLLCAMIFIWGKVAYDFSLGASEQDESVLPSVARAHRTPAGAVTPRVAPPDFDGEIRDPFAPPEVLFRAKPRSATALSQKKPEAAAEPPPFTLVGIVDETALLQGPGDLIVFARAGEEVFDVRFVEVAADRVVARFGGRSYTLELPD